MRYELQIALRYLRARRKSAFVSITTLFTAIGVMIGVAALAVVLSVMGGFEDSLRQRVLSLTPQIQILNYAGSLSNYAAIQALADKLPAVAGSDPFVVGQALVSSGSGVSGVLVRGLDVNNPASTFQLRRYVEQGKLASLAATAPPAGAGQPAAPLGAMALGAALAEKLKVRVGDPLRVVAPIIGAGPSGLTTRSGAFEVGAIFNSGISYIDRNVAFIGLDRAQSFFGREGRVDGIEVRLRDLDATSRVATELRRLLPESYRVRTWIEFNQAASAGFAMLKRVYSLVLLLLIAVAAFNLVATLIMVVMEKRKDIAVLMTMGASRREIGMIFVLKGFIVGGAGTLAGLMVGSAACFALARYHFIRIPKEIYGISTLPIAVSPLSFVLVALCSVALCLLATFYPAWQASHQMPVEVMRS